MTDEERQLIQTLADHVKSAPPAQVDRDADNLIRSTIGARPDALYILTQTVLIQEMALNQAKQQIEQLKQQPAQPPASFLPSAPAPPQPAPYRSGGYQGSSYQRSDYAPPPPPPPPQYEYEPQPSGGRFSSFLHNAAQTAAGVVAGEVAFSALSSIFGHHGGGGGFFGGGGYGISPGSETIINNYYDDDRGRSGGFGSDRPLEDSGLSPDLEDRRFAGGDSGDAPQQDDAPQDDVQQDDSDTNDNGSDNDDSFDDGSSSYDDGSGSNDV
jgi:hypothetical protein